jgi:hypothetical protein
MSCFDGLVEYANITGDAEVLHACEMFHEELKAHELNPMFSVGFNDIFKHAAVQLNAISEPCDAIHWMRLCSELFYATGKNKYLDDFERVFYNAFLAAACFDGTWGARGVRSHGHHYYATNQANMQYHHCCVNNMPRGFINAAQSFVTIHGNEVHVNLYTDYQADFTIGDSKVSIRIDGSRYLSDGTVEIHIRNSADTLPLHLRIPDWATSARLEGSMGVVDGSGDHFVVYLPSGDSILKLSFTRTLEIHNRIPVTESQEWCIRRWVGNDIPKESYRAESGSWLVYGPLLLARSKLEGNTSEEMFKTAHIPFGFGASISPRPAPKRTLAAFDLNVVYTDTKNILQTHVCDYASAGNVFNEKEQDPELFSIFF